MDPLDEFIEKRGGGKSYQYFALTLLCLIQAYCGATIMMAGILLPTVTKEFNLSKLEIALLSLFYHFGVIGGSIYGAVLTKSLGRSFLIKITLALNIIGGLVFILCTNYGLCLLFNLVLGAFGGVFSTVLNIYINEIAPLNVRGVLTVVTSGSITVGRLMGVGLAYAMADFNVPGEWQLLMVVISLVSVVFLPFCLLFMAESLRFLFKNKMFAEFIRNFNQIVKFNAYFNKDTQYKQEKIGQSDVDQLMGEKANEQAATEQAGLKALFDRKFMRRNILLWLIWFGCYGGLNGQTLILSFWFGNDASGVKNIAVTIFGEIPSIVVSCLVIDKVTIGRKKSLQVYSFGMLLFCVLSFFIENQSAMSLAFMLMRFFFKGCFLILVPYTAEAYPTSLRAHGMGICGAVGAFSSCLLPYVLLRMFFWDRYSIFFLFMFMSAISFGSAMFLTFETAQKSLDVDLEKPMTALENELVVD